MGMRATAVVSPVSVSIQRMGEVPMQLEGQGRIGQGAEERIEIRQRPAQRAEEERAAAELAGHGRLGGDRPEQCLGNEVHVWMSAVQW